MFLFDFTEHKNEHMFSYSTNWIQDLGALDEASR
jgi:hypothetical protein